MVIKIHEIRTTDDLLTVHDTGSFIRSFILFTINSDIRSIHKAIVLRYDNQVTACASDSHVLTVYACYKFPYYHY